jgi:uncharacterized membrane protein SirB2
MRRFYRFLSAIIDDLLYLAGCGLIIYATAILSIVAALYVAGGLCIVGGVLIGFSRLKRTKQ